MSRKFLFALSFLSIFAMPTGADSPFSSCPVGETITISGINKDDRISVVNFSIQNDGIIALTFVNRYTTNQKQDSVCDYTTPYGMLTVRIDHAPGSEPDTMSVVDAPAGYHAEPESVNVEEGEEETIYVVPDVFG